MVSLYRTDEDVKEAVEAEIRFDPSIKDEAHIAVSVNGGVVTLSGSARTFMDAYYAEKAAKRIQGVKGLANDIHVKLPTERSDSDIAEEAVRALRRDLPGASEGIKPAVKNGFIALEGQVEWNFQREWAERAVRGISGVQGISNQVRVAPRVAASDVKRKIEQALVRSAQIDADRITVQVDGSKVILKGSVRAWAEREQAQRSAWSATGVTSVQNEIIISG